MYNSADGLTINVRWVHIPLHPGPADTEPVRVREWGVEVDAVGLLLVSILDVVQFVQPHRC